MTDLARRLADARLKGTVVAIDDDAAGSGGPADLDAAYALLERVTAALGWPRAGWKVGSTSREAQAKLGTAEPGAAPLFEPGCYDSPAAVPVFPAHDPHVEGEFAFRLAADLPPRSVPYDRGEVLAAIGAVAPAVEVVGTRLAGGLGRRGRLWTTADGSANVAFVAGPWVADWRRFDLPAHQVRIFKNGSLAAEGEGARALGDPLEVMAWLANHARTRAGLRAGEIVTTGTCTGLTPVAVGDRLVADFGTLGRAEMDFVAARPSGPDR